MAPRGSALPQATTESAREARKAFFCELCQKAYARVDEYESHQNSYDHQHRKRLKEMRALTKDPNAAAKARAAENEVAGIRSVTTSSTAGIKKKPVFKSTLQPRNAEPVSSSLLTKGSTGSSLLGAGSTAAAGMGFEEYVRNGRGKGDGLYRAWAGSQGWRDAEVWDWRRPTEFVMRGMELEP